MKRYGWISILLCISLLTGCTDIADNQNILSEKERHSSVPESLGLEPEFNYEVPLSLPGILVDQAGYGTESKKIAVFRGNHIPDSFEVINEETGEAAFYGKVEHKGYNEAIGEYNSYGIFDELEEEGVYYIRAPVLGRSYSFEIAEDIYGDIFNRACRQYYLNRCGITLVKELAGEAAHNGCHTKIAELSENPEIQMDVSGGWHMDENHTRNVGKGSQVMANLLLAYELYPESFTDECGIPESGNGVPDILDEIKYEADWMLKMQDSATGGIYSEIKIKEMQISTYSTKQDILVEPVTLEATAAFAAVISKFSYIYQAYNTAYATECLRAADRAWRFMENNRNGQEVGQRFWASAELYRATGYRYYRKAAEEYMRDGIYKKMEDNFIFWGCVTYISTKQSVNVEICSNVMKNLMEEAEQISAKARQSRYLTAGNKEQDNNDELLHQMMRLTVVDHIITNHEYKTVIENHMHYFLGRNPKAISYIDGTGENNYADINAALSIMNRFDLNAELIFMLSEIMGWHRILTQ